jgi:hypothetical protein
MPDPAATRNLKSGPRKITCKLTLDFANLHLDGTAGEDRSPLPADAAVTGQVAGGTGLSLT